MTSVFQSQHNHRKRRLSLNNRGGSPMKKIRVDEDHIGTEENEENSAMQEEMLGKGTSLI